MLTGIRRWWNNSKAQVEACAEAYAMNAQINVGQQRADEIGRSHQRATKKLADMIDAKLNKRRVEWDNEDAELRVVMGQAAGAGDWGEMMRRLGVRKPALEEMGGAPAISARFDSAITTDDNRSHWAMADGLAADAAANPMIRYTLRNRARYEIANNCYAAGVGETIANDFCGTGPRLHIDDERLSDEEMADVEAKFLAWTQAVDLPGKLRTMRKARRGDGETFACKITNPKLAHPVKLDLRVLEADQIRFVDISLLLSPSVDGIRYDDFGNPVSYHILRIHPGYWSYATGYVGMPWEYDVWDASLVIHWFRQDRPGQHRGLPEILPALPLYATLRRYTAATLDAAETAADFAVLLETQAGAMFIDENGETTEGVTEAQAFSTQQLQRRMMAALPAGYKATQMQPTQPTQEYAGFKQEVCAEIGRCECVPKNVVLADSSGSNFASGQLDHKIYFRTREIEREEANRLILDSLLTDWIAEGVRLREVVNEKYGSAVSYLPQILRTLGANVSHSWYWDSNELGDPLKLAAAKSTAMKDGLTSIPAEYEAKGKNWARVFVGQARALGCTVDELKDMIRNSIYPAGGAAPIDATAMPSEDGKAESDKPPARETVPAVKRPGQGALQKVAAQAAYAAITAYNENHDEKGQFAEGPGGGPAGGKKSKASDLFDRLPQDVKARLIQEVKDSAAHPFVGHPPMPGDKYVFTLQRVAMKDLLPTQEGEDRLNDSSRGIAEMVKDAHGDPSSFLKDNGEGLGYPLHDLAPILVKDGKIIDGNHRFTAAQLLGDTHVLALVVTPKLIMDAPGAPTQNLHGAKPAKAALQKATQ